MSKVENKLIRRRIVNAYLSSVISISLVLLLVGLASMLLVNAESVSNYFKENVKVSVLLKPEVEDTEATEFKPDLDKLPFIRSSAVVTKEQGRLEMEKMLGEDFLDVFEVSPIPVSFDITLNAAYVTPDSLAFVRSELDKNDLVDEVVCQDSLIEALNTNLRKISMVLGVLILLLLFISFVLITNMMHLIVYSRRFTIHTMKLVGATKSFIRGPFLVKSAILGLFSAFLAILMLVGILFFIRNEFAQLFEVFQFDLLLQVIGIVVASGLFICVTSTFFVVGRLVSLDKDKLY